MININEEANTTDKTIILINKIIILAQSIKFHGFDKYLNNPRPVVIKQSNQLLNTDFVILIHFNLISSSIKI